ncbi:MAG TPA: LysR family transcriptional regulator [Thermoanaerobaculia bacterium]
MIDFDALHAFSVFARTRNFTRAAEALHISQPALHVKIAKLGTALGVALYRRRGRELELTDAGQQVARFGSETRASVDEFVARLRGVEPHEPVVLAAGEGALLYLLAPAIREWQRQRPAAPLRILSRDREATLEAVRSGEAHVGVAVLEAAPDDLQAPLLARAGSIVAMPSRHPLARRRELQPADLKGAPMIVPPAGRPHREAFSRAMLERDLPWTVAVEVSGWPLMLELARSGVGLAVVNSTCVLPRGVVGRPLRGVPAVHYRLLYSRGRRSDTAEQLIAMIGKAKNPR